MSKPIFMNFLENNKLQIVNLKFGSTFGGKKDILIKIEEEKFMSKNTKLKQIENKLKEAAPLRLKGLLKKRKETTEEFIKKFFEKWNKELPTIYVNNKHIQTDPDKRRSIGDIFKIMEYYYPDITLEEVTNLVYNLNLPHFRSSNCNTIKKRVFYLGEEDQNRSILEKDHKDEYGLTVKEWLNE